MTLKGILPVVPTPFMDGRFDERSFAALVEHSAPHVDGYTVLGSTGEAPSMTTAERRAITERMVDLIPNGLDVIVGVTHTSVSDGTELARHASALGAAGVLCAAPYYFLGSHDGVLAYLAAIDAAIDTELIFYDNSAATKLVARATEVTSWSQKLEHLNAVKLTDHDLSKIDVWHAAGLSVFAGDDPIALRFLQAGVDGAMLIVPAVFPEAFRGVWTAVREDDAVSATQLFGREIAPFTHVFGIGDEIATTKALFAAIGIFASPEVRPPLEAVEAQRLTMLRAAYDLSSQATRTG